MKTKNILTALMLLFVCAGTCTTLSSCSKDDTEENGPSGNNNSGSNENNNGQQNQEIVVTVDANGNADGGHYFTALDSKTFFVDYIKYTIKEGHLVVSGYDETGLKSINGKATIVSKIIYKGVPYAVLEIEEAFKNCVSLTSVTISNSVTSIGSSAFYYCTSLTSITIPNSVTSIGGWAFDRTAWYNNQPDGLVYAGKVAYKYKGTMPNGTQITIEDGTLGIAGEAFRDCRGLTSITIPESVTSIGASAFKGCTSLTSITIPNSVTSIGGSTFSHCSSLNSITIPESVTSIGGSAFKGCSSLTSIKVETDNLTYDSRDNCNAIIETATNTLIAGCMNTIIPESVTSIGSSAFSGCSGLTSITIPNSVTSIGESAFFNCTSLTSITIPNSVTSIGGWAFQGCSGLTSVTIPNSVTSIGNNAFDGTAWYDNLPDGLVYAGKVAYKYKGTMPNGTQITIEDGTLEIADAAFFNCSGLTSVTIPNSVTSIGYGAFYGCSGLTSITIPNSVTSIWDDAFSYCDNLTSITIGSGVTNIGERAFYGCISLTDVYCYAENVPSTDPDAFYDTPFSSVTLHVPEGSVHAYRVIYPWSHFKSIVAIE